MTRFANLKFGLASTAMLASVTGAIMGFMGLTPTFFDKPPTGAVLQSSTVGYNFTWSQVTDPNANSLFFDLKKNFQGWEEGTADQLPPNATSIFKNLDCASTYNYRVWVQTGFNFGEGYYHTESSIGTGSCPAPYPAPPPVYGYPTPPTTYPSPPAPPPPAPAPSNPVPAKLNSSVTQSCATDSLVNLTFSWTPATGATFDLQYIDINTTGTDPWDGTQLSVGQSRVRIDNIAHKTTIYWRVNTHVAGGNWYPSDVSSLTTKDCGAPPPAPVPPADPTNPRVLNQPGCVIYGSSYSVIVAWNAVPDAQTYFVRVDYGSRGIKDQDVGNVTQVTIPDLYPDESYFWAVSAWNPNGVSPGVGSTIQAIPSCPLAPPPSGGTPPPTGGTPTLPPAPSSVSFVGSDCIDYGFGFGPEPTFSFAWSKVSTADGYWFDISENSSFSPFSNKQIVGNYNTSFTWAADNPMLDNKAPENGKTYYFRVTSYNSAGVYIPQTVGSTSITKDCSTGSGTPTQPPPPPPDLEFPPEPAVLNREVGQTCVPDQPFVNIFFSWTPAKGATFDAQFIDINTTGTDPWDGTPVVVGQSFVTIANISHNTQIFWRINTHVAGGDWYPSQVLPVITENCGSGTPGTPTEPAPEPGFPPDPAVLNREVGQSCGGDGFVNIFFSWTPAKGATFDLQYIDINTTGQEPWNGTPLNVGQSSVRIDSIADNTQIFWRINTHVAGGDWYPSQILPVITENSADLCGKPSEGTPPPVACESPSAFSLKDPTNGKVLTDPFTGFQWTDATGENSYIVDLSQDGFATWWHSPPLGQNITTSPWPDWNSEFASGPAEQKFWGGLPPGEDFQWRVAAFNTCPDGNKKFTHSSETFSMSYVPQSPTQPPAAQVFAAQGLNTGPKNDGFGSQGLVGSYDPATGIGAYFGWQYDTRNKVHPFIRQVAYLKYDDGQVPSPTNALRVGEFESDVQTFSLTGLTPNQAHAWNIYTCADEACNFNAKSPVDKFETIGIPKDQPTQTPPPDTTPTPPQASLPASPILNAPVNGATYNLNDVNNLIFTWQDPKGNATYYWLDISQSEDFAEWIGCYTTQTVVGYKQCSWEKFQDDGNGGTNLGANTPFEDLNGTYYWRVAPGNDTGLCPCPSETRRFSVVTQNPTPEVPIPPRPPSEPAPPTVVLPNAPANISATISCQDTGFGFTEPSISFTWARVSNAQGYWLDVSGNNFAGNQFANKDLNGSNTTSFTWDFDNPLNNGDTPQNGTTYHYRVTSFNSAGINLNHTYGNSPVSIDCPQEQVPPAPPAPDTPSTPLGFNKPAPLSTADFVCDNEKSLWSAKFTWLPGYIVENGQERFAAEEQWLELKINDGSDWQTVAGPLEATDNSYNLSGILPNQNYVWRVANLYFKTLYHSDDLQFTTGPCEKVDFQILVTPAVQEVQPGKEAAFAINFQYSPDWNEELALDPTHGATINDSANQPTIHLGYDLNGSSTQHKQSQVGLKFAIDPNASFGNVNLNIEACNPFRTICHSSPIKITVTDPNSQVYDWVSQGIAPAAESVGIHFALLRSTADRECGAKYGATPEQAYIATTNDWWISHPELHKFFCYNTGIGGSGPMQFNTGTFNTMISDARYKPNRDYQKNVNNLGASIFAAAVYHRINADIAKKYTGGVEDWTNSLNNDWAFVRRIFCGYGAGNATITKCAMIVNGQLVGYYDDELLKTYKTFLGATTTQAAPTSDNLNQTGATGQDISITQTFQIKPSNLRASFPPACSDEPYTLLLEWDSNGTGSNWWVDVTSSQEVPFPPGSFSNKPLSQDDLANKYTGTGDFVRLEPNTYYYWRIWYGVDNVWAYAIEPFIVSSCQSTATAVGGTDLITPINPLTNQTEATNLSISQGYCINEKVSLTFNWTKGSPETHILSQWIDVSEANDGFTSSYHATTQPPSYGSNFYETGTQSIDPNHSGWHIPHLEPNTTYYWRINTLFEGDQNWRPSTTHQFTTINCVTYYTPPSAEISSTSSSRSNLPPNLPTVPSGPEATSAFIPTRYFFLASDPEGDILDYYVDWGDGSFSTIVSFGGWKYPNPLTQEHMWTSQGKFFVRVKAIDPHRAESGWSEPLTVTVAGNSIDCTNLVFNGDSSTKLDVTFIPVSYRENEMSLFENDVRNYAIPRLTLYQPFSSRTNAFNFNMIKFPSFEPAQSLSQQSIQLSKVCPTDQVIEISNRVVGEASQALYGIASLRRSDLLQISAAIAHEFGHSFGRLADEYVYPGGGGPRIDGHNCSLSKDKPFWEGYPGTSTFQGCSGTQWFRPTENSIMREAAQTRTDGFDPWNIKLLSDLLKFYE